MRLNRIYGVRVLFVVLCAFASSTTVRAQELAWSPTNTGIPSYAWGRDVWSLAVSGTTLYAGTYHDAGGVVFRSDNNGDSWTAVGDPLPDVRTIAKAVTSLGTTMFAGTDGDPGGGIEGVYRLLDGTAVWQPSGPIELNYVTNFAHMGGALFAGGAYGLFRTSDGGDTWTNVLSGGAYSVAVSGSTLYVGTAGSGVKRSSDLGATWETVGTGLTYVVRALAVSGTTVLAGSDANGVYRLPNGETTWQVSSSGLTDSYCRSFAQVGASLFLGTAVGGVFRSDDGGVSWQPVNSGLTNTMVRALAVSGTTLFAASAGGGVFKAGVSLPPTFGTITPTTAQRGSSVTITFTGSNLGGVTTVRLRHPTTSATLAGSNVTATATSVSADFDLSGLSSDWEGGAVIEYSTGGSFTSSGISLTITPPPPPAYQNWLATVTLTGDPLGDTDVTVGVALDASNDFLFAEDILAPPPIPNTPYIHILTGGQDLQKDMRLFADSVTWNLAVRVVSGTNYVDVSGLTAEILDFYDASRIEYNGDSYTLPLTASVALTTGSHSLSLIIEKRQPVVLSTTLGVRWTLFSLPGPTTDGSPHDLSDRGVVTMYGWDATAQNWPPAVSLTPSDPLAFVGTGYAVFRAPEPDPADSDPNTGPLATTFAVDIGAPDALSVDVTLKPGWNLVGAPYNGTAAASYNATPNTVFRLDGLRYPVATSLVAFQGYWVFNETDTPQTRTITQGTPVAPALVRRQPTPSWGAPLTVVLDSGEDFTVELGVEKSANVGFDALDVPLPPPMPVAGYSEFYAATTDRVGRLTRSVLPARQESASWTLTANLAEAGTLRWDALKLPDGYRLTLESGNERFDLSESGSTRLSAGRSSFTARLTFSAPTKTRLMANFPNPFNPETWIPFELKEGSDVTVTVFDVSGNVVRRLDLGYRDAGYYTSRDEAVYWDGKNDLGERVSSGVYVVQFRAGETRDLRRVAVLK